MKTCAVVRIVLINIRRIIASKLCYSSWLPAISQKIDKTSDENHGWTLLSLFISLSVVLGYVIFQNKFFEYTEMGGTSSR